MPEKRAKEVLNFKKTMDMIHEETKQFKMLENFVRNLAEEKNFGFIVDRNRFEDDIEKECYMIIIPNDSSIQFRRKIWNEFYDKIVQYALNNEINIFFEVGLTVIRVKKDD